MKDFGLVVIGAHFGVWLQGEIAKYKNQNILLVEPVPYNYKILKKNFSVLFSENIAFVQIKILSCSPKLFCKIL